MLPVASAAPLAVVAWILLLAVAGVAEGYRVQFDVEVPGGPKSFVMDVQPSWSPNGAARVRLFPMRDHASLLTSNGLSQGTVLCGGWGLSLLHLQAIIGLPHPQLISLFSTRAPLCSLRRLSRPNSTTARASFA